MRRLRTQGQMLCSTIIHVGVYPYSIFGGMLSACEDIADGAQARTVEEQDSNAIGLGSHTDLQCFTLLWQDMVGGLQVLTKDGQWIKVRPLR